MNGEPTQCQQKISGNLSSPSVPRFYEGKVPRFPIGTPNAVPGSQVPPIGGTGDRIGNQEPIGRKK